MFNCSDWKKQLVRWSLKKFGKTCEVVLLVQLLGSELVFHRLFTALQQRDFSSARQWPFCNKLKRNTWDFCTCSSSSVFGVTCTCSDWMNGMHALHNWYLKRGEGPGIGQDKQNETPSTIERSDEQWRNWPAGTVAMVWPCEPHGGSGRETGRPWNEMKKLFFHSRPQTIAAAFGMLRVPRACHFSSGSSHHAPPNSSRSSSQQRGCHVMQFSSKLAASSPIASDLFLLRDPCPSSSCHLGSSSYHAPTLLLLLSAAFLKKRRPAQFCWILSTEETGHSQCPLNHGQGSAHHLPCSLRL